MALPWMFDVLLLGILLLLGTAIIILIEAAIFFLPTTVLAVVVFWFTRSFALAGLAFALVAILSLLKRKR